MSLSGSGPRFKVELTRVKVPSGGPLGGSRFLVPQDCCRPLPTTVPPPDDFCLDNLAGNYGCYNKLGGPPPPKPGFQFPSSVRMTIYNLAYAWRWDGRSADLHWRTGPTTGGMTGFYYGAIPLTELYCNQTVGGLTFCSEMYGWCPIVWEICRLPEQSSSRSILSGKLMFSSGWPPITLFGYNYYVERPLPLLNHLCLDANGRVRPPTDPAPLAPVSFGSPFAYSFGFNGLCPGRESTWEPLYQVFDGQVFEAQVHDRTPQNGFAGNLRVVITG